MLDELGGVVGIEDVGGRVAGPPIIEHADDLDVACWIASDEVGEELDEPFLAVLDRSGVVGVSVSCVGVDRLDAVPVTDRLEVEGCCVVRSLSRSPDSSPLGRSGVRTSDFVTAAVGGLSLRRPLRHRQSCSRSGPSPS